MNATIIDTPCARLACNSTPYGVECLGMPYAEPPTGERRFLPPVPIRRASAVIDARTAGAAPVQPIRPAPWWYRSAPPRTSEDCLNLSVFTPAADGARRPVLVHVFGGGFEGGSGSGGIQDAARLAAAGDCVVVRLNFRVGALGFLHLGEVWGDPYRAGNVALLDVCAALEWVQANIAALGGDPDNVTLFGLSSGAFMIAALFGTPQSRGLFHKAWMQSGSASRIVDRRIAAAQARAFLELLDVAPGDTTALANIDVSRILEAQDRIVAKDLGERNAPGGRTLGVVDDGRTLTVHPLDAFRRGDRREIPILLGTTRGEARLWFAMGAMRDVSSDDEVCSEMARFVGRERAPALFARYRDLLRDMPLARLRERFLTDAIYRLPGLRTAIAHSNAGGRAWMYQFAWEPAVEADLGASHGFDESFVWGVADPEQIGYLRGDQTERRIASKMSSALVQFATNGAPGWPPYSADDRITRVFGPREASLEDVDSQIAAAWEGIERR